MQNEEWLPAMEPSVGVAAPCPPESSPVPRFDPTLVSPAEWAFRRLALSIRDFERTLDQDHEVGVRLAHFGGSTIIQISDIGYWAPDLLKFYGHDADGNQVVLLQHISQISVLLLALRKVTDQPRRIGFQLEQKLEEASTPDTAAATPDAAPPAAPDSPAA